MTTSRFPLHVLGLNVARLPEDEQAALRMSGPEAAHLLRGLAAAQPGLEAVVLRARNHLEAYLHAPAGTDAPRLWLRHLGRARPDLLLAQRRGLHYALAGPAAARHLFGFVCGRFARCPHDPRLQRGVKRALGLAAASGTLGEVLDGLFLQALHVAALARVLGPEGEATERLIASALADWARQPSLTTAQAAAAAF